MTLKATPTPSRVGILACVLAFATATSMAQAQSHYEKLPDLPFRQGYAPKGDAPTLTDELFFQRAVQTYLWALPALNMYGMKEGSEKVFGKGYNVLPVAHNGVAMLTSYVSPEQRFVTCTNQDNNRKERT